MKAQWQQLQRKRAESGASVPDAPARPEKFAQRYTEILEDLKKDLESHSGPPDCIARMPSFSEALKRMESALLTKAKQRIASTYENKSG
ncbi:hypothetical protein DVH24_000774 [Malus domestica]|uniref:Uncharacterized protein n=1 Tax=Malus domestica TaxID=3750 RepID=A0A498JXC7_MALDO|nr:hypothetical protein DVH24_000774 [Malus domestica]